MLFARPSTNALYALELTSKSITVSRLPSRGQCTFFEQDQDLYAWVRTPREILVIGGDGAVYSLIPVSADSDDDSAEEYRVPPTFWATPRRAGPDISEITGTDPSQNYNSLYSDSVAYFHTPVVNKMLTFHIRDPTLAIVGVMLSFGSHGDEHRPAQVVLNGRTYRTKKERHYMFPLKPSEVHAGQSVTLFFPGRIDCDIIMQTAVIFVMPFEKIRPFLTRKSELPEWMLRPRALLDFQERGGGRGAQAAAHQIVRAIEGTTGASEIGSDVIDGVVKLMYRSKEFAGAARGAIVRVAAAEPSIVVKWAEGLERLLKEGGDDILWDTVWRDLSLMEPEWQGRLQEAAWAAQPALGSIGAAVAAFGFPEE
jgi:hypothetical protein